MATSAAIVTGFPNLGDGSVSQPSLAFQSDSDTGLYRIGANTIGIATNGTRVGEIGVGYGGFTGNVIQVLNFSNTFRTLTTSTTPTDVLSATATPWEVSITPRYSNSKIIFLHACQGLIGNGSSNAAYCGIAILRKIGAGAYSTIYTPAQNTSSGYLDAGLYGQGTSAIERYDKFVNFHVDSPSSTSTITYKMQMSVYGSTMNFQLNTANTSNTGTSYILLAEVQQ